MPRFLLPAALCCLAAPALAEVDLGFYGGAQAAADSDVSVEGDAALPEQGFTAGWEAPPQYGLRATWWPERFGGRLGFGLDANRVGVRADDGTLDESGLDRLEFSDGLNILTLNGMRRWPDAFGPVTPYVGAGVGVAIPRVEVEGAGSRTGDYQLTGPAVTLMAGASVPIAENWSVFGEYKGTYSMNEADLDGGGTLEADVLTNAVNVGVSFSF